MEQAFLTVPEAAQLLRVHENTIYNMVKTHRLEHYKVGNQIRISTKALDRLRVPAEREFHNETNE